MISEPVLVPVLFSLLLLRSLELELTTAPFQRRVQAQRGLLSSFLRAPWPESAMSSVPLCQA